MLWSAACTKACNRGTSVLYAVYHVKYFTMLNILHVSRNLSQTSYLDVNYSASFVFMQLFWISIYLCFYTDSSGLKCCCIVFDDEVCALIFFTNKRVSMIG